MHAPWCSILLHVDATPASIGRLQVALDIAERHDARITAVFAGSSPEPEGSFAYSAAAALDDLATSRRSEWRELATARLRRAAGDDRSRIAWSEIAGAEIVSGFVAEAAYADLLVLGAPASAADAGAAPPGFVEAVVFETGRPALVVPDVPASARIGRRILVAWNGSAQAARAVTGALPLLAQAEAVHVASWSHAPASAPCSGLSIEGYLGRHGIAAELHRHGPSGHVGDELAGLAGRLDVDLIVMGCYGHSRARERVLGGVSRSMLQAPRSALLLAH